MVCPGAVYLVLPYLYLHLQKTSPPTQITHEYDTQQQHTYS
jgi:hypothetical protein